MPVNITFDQNTVDRTECVNLTAIEDGMFEDLETFSLRLTTTDPGVTVNPTQSSAIVAIYDADG